MKRVDIIYKAFEGDEDILTLCDQDMGARTIGELAKEIDNKLKDYEAQCDCHFVSISDKGYFFYTDNLLISFGINKALRKSNILWDKIKHTIEGNFHCMLYNNNIRAIKWLVKNGMKIIKQDTKITILCQLQ